MYSIHVHELYTYVFRARQYDSEANMTDKNKNIEENLNVEGTKQQIFFKGLSEHGSTLL